VISFSNDAQINCKQNIKTNKIISLNKKTSSTTLISRRVKITKENRKNKNER
jgi:hypothetical protein